MHPKCHHCNCSFLLEGQDYISLPQRMDKSIFIKIATIKKNKKRKKKERNKNMYAPRPFEITLKKIAENKMMKKAIKTKTVFLGLLSIIR